MKKRLIFLATILTLVLSARAQTDPAIFIADNLGGTENYHVVVNMVKLHLDPANEKQHRLDGDALHRHESYG